MAQDQDQLYTAYSWVLISLNIVFFAVSLCLLVLFFFLFYRLLNVSKVYRYFTIRKIPIFLLAMLSSLLFGASSVAGIFLFIANAYFATSNQYVGPFKTANTSILALDQVGIVFTVPALSLILCHTIVTLTIRITNLKIKKIAAVIREQRETTVFTVSMGILIAIAVFFYCSIYLILHFMPLLEAASQSASTGKSTIKTYLVFVSFSYIVIVVAVLIFCALYPTLYRCLNPPQKMRVREGDEDFEEEAEDKSLEEEKEEQTQSSAFEQESFNQYLNKYNLQRGEDPVAQASYQVFIATLLVAQLCAIFLFAVKVIPLFTNFADEWGYYERYATLVNKGLMLVALSFILGIMFYDYRVHAVEEAKYNNFTAKKTNSISFATPESINETL